MNDSMIFYRSFYEAIQDLPEADQLVLYNAIFQYSYYKTEPNLSGICNTIFKVIRPQIDSNEAKRVKHLTDIENGKKGKEFGKLGGRPGKEKTPLKTPPNNPPENPPLNPPRNPINVNVNVNDNVNGELVGENKPPMQGSFKQRQTTPEELAEYLKSETNLLQLYRSSGSKMELHKFSEVVTDRINNHSLRGDFEKYKAGTLLGFISADIKETKTKKPIFGRTNQ